MGVKKDIENLEMVCYITLIIAIMSIVIIFVGYGNWTCIEWGEEYSVNPEFHEICYVENINQYFTVEAIGEREYYGGKFSLGNEEIKITKEMFEICKEDNIYIKEDICIMEAVTREPKR